MERDSLSLVLPCFNEEANIERTIRESFLWLSKEQKAGVLLGYEVIVVDDGSRDRSPEILRNVQQEFSQLRVLSHTKNLGYGATLCKGCDAASMDFISFMDSDGQFHASDFSRLIPFLREVDFVSGERECRADPWHRRLYAWLYNFLVRVVLRIPVYDVNCAMKVFRRDIWGHVRPSVTSGALFNAELFLRLKECRIPWKTCPVPHYPRQGGSPTGGSLRVILRAIWELRSLARSHRPSPSPSPTSTSATPEESQASLSLGSSRSGDPRVVQSREAARLYR